VNAATRIQGLLRSLLRNDASTIRGREPGDAGFTDTSAMRGEPTAAFLELVAAIARGDSAMLLSRLLPARRRALEELRDAGDPRFAMAMAELATTRDWKVDAERIDGDHALLDITARADDGAALGRVEMLRIHQRWYLDRISSR
jgi:hypothetical protein